MIVFAWNVTNVGHIGKHDVDIDEAELVIRDAEPPFPMKVEDDKLLVWGKTASGRWLQVVFVFVEDEQIDFDEFNLQELVEIDDGADIVRVIHARELTADEKKRARKLLR